MKAVVVELNHTKAAVLSDDGRITTIKNQNYEIGQIIQLTQPSVINIKKKLSALTACASALIFVSVGSWAYASPYSYVSVDINPSIEFTVNRFDRVIRVTAANDDGEEIVKQISLSKLKNHNINDAVTKAVNQISEQGYFDTTSENQIVIAASSKNTEKADELTQELQEAVTLEASVQKNTINVEVFQVEMDHVQKAEELGVTPGKLNLVEKLQKAAAKTTDISLEEWLDKPVREIMKATKEYENSKSSTTAGSDAEETITKEQTGQENNEDNLTKKNQQAEVNAEKQEDKATVKEDKTKVKEGTSKDKQGQSSSGSKKTDSNTGTITPKASKSGKSEASESSSPAASKSDSSKKNSTKADSKTKPETTKPANSGKDTSGKQDQNRKQSDMNGTGTKTPNSSGKNIKNNTNDSDTAVSPDPSSDPNDLNNDNNKQVSASDKDTPPNDLDPGSENENSNNDSNATQNNNNNVDGASDHESGTVNVPSDTTGKSGKTKSDSKSETIVNKPDRSSSTGTSQDTTTVSTSGQKGKN